MQKKFEVFEVGGALGGEAYLLITEEKTALIDSGFSFCAPQMIENINTRLKGRTLDYVLLTHSHYDHASGSAYCRAEWPDAEIIASAYAAKILAKGSARKIMREMNTSAAVAFGATDHVDLLDTLEVTTVVKDGDLIDLGSLIFEVIEAPGHTNCCIAFWCREERFLISCETMGVYAGENHVMPGYLVHYQTSIDFILKVRSMGPQILLISHYGIITQERCKTFIDDALRCNQKAMQTICSGHTLGLSEGTLIANYKRDFYTETIRRIQPEVAFDLNASYTIPMIIKECCEA
jgi:2-aminobenzoylacetyl-CoA thioesterase